MSKYVLDNLTWRDFEDLSRDIIQNKEKVCLETFADGIDQGIDFQYLKNKEINLVVQCKHINKWSDLKSKLKKETTKVEKIQPTRYILVTSCSLTKKRKEDVLKIFSPFLLSTSDIIAKTDIDNFLDLNEDIAKKNYKLWFSSVAVLEKILHNALVGRSEYKRKEILDNVKLYVPNINENKAIKILNDNGYIIISGVPGIGKTTLAEVLVARLLDCGYKLVFCTDLKEAESIFDENSKQVFFYDDFLGRTFLNTMRTRNEDQHIANFIKRLKRTNCKLILTTREYILQQARDEYERLDQKIDLVKCTIELSDYSRYEKGLILYNHLYYSNLNKEFIKNLLFRDRYLDIINHQNYNPRIIRVMTLEDEIFNINCNQFYKEFMNVLNDPKNIWEKPFKKQIMKSSQYLLYSLLLAETKCYNFYENGAPVDRLEDYFINFVKYLYNKGIAHIDGDDFKLSLHELDNCFISSYLNDEKDTIITFHNPSIKDYLIQHIGKDKKLVSILIDVADTIETLLSIFTINTSKLSHKIYLDNNQERYLMGVIVNNYYKYKDTQYKNSQSSLLAVLRNIIDFFSQHRSKDMNQLLNNEFNKINVSKLMSEKDLMDYITIVKNLRKDSKNRIVTLIETIIEITICKNNANSYDIYDAKKLAILYAEFEDYFIEYCDSQEIDIEEFISEIVNFETCDIASEDEYWLIDLHEKITEIEKLLGYDYKDILSSIDYAISYLQFEDDDNRIEVRDNNISRKDTSEELKTLFHTILNKS